MRLKSLLGINNWLWILIFFGVCLFFYFVVAYFNDIEGFSFKLFLATCALIYITGPLVTWMIDSTESLPAYLGELAVAETDISPEGTIRFKDGEKRLAISHGPSIFKGEEVTVTEVREKGKILVVGRANPPGVTTDAWSYAAFSDDSSQY